MPTKKKSNVVVKKNVSGGGFVVNGCTFHVAEKYSPIDAIGQGSYGVVCSAENTLTKEKVAIKKIKPMAGDEWDATHTLREIRLMKSLGDHENIIALKDLSMCEEKDELYMMMELVDTDLHRLIQSHTRLTNDHIRVIMYQLLCGVQAMHDNGVLHRDLKPGNLLVNKNCELKITDFGLARMIPKGTQQSNTNDEKAVSAMTEYVVTRWYRPPELMLAPNGCYTGAVDMWSVGCILGELLLRKPLFPGNDFIDQLTRVFKIVSIPDPSDRGYEIEKDALKFLNGIPKSLPNVYEKVFKNASGDAIHLLQKLLCFNPDERYTVEEALAHPFLHNVENDWGEIKPLKLLHSLEFAFEEDKSMSLESLRQFIRDEVHLFSKKNAPKANLQNQPMHSSKNNKNSEENPEDDSSSISNVENGGNFPIGNGFETNGCNFNISKKYDFIQHLGEGSYGIVCSAFDKKLLKKVAIKKISPMAGDEWDACHTLRELRLMRYFGGHNNIASLLNLSTCTEKDELYLMMELVDTDLHKLIQSETKLEQQHIEAILYQILCGAKVLHENGVLHRDLKPGNILVNKDCCVKITDFGLSRLIPPSGKLKNNSDEAPAMTEYVVTRWYRSPELMLAPNGEYTAAVDMWSIGCILGELLNRNPVFPGDDFMDQISRVFSVLPVPPAEKRGYKIEGDALRFLNSLPKCNPESFLKTFPTASAEALSLLRRLLCINPQRRITASQALQHPFFKNVRKEWPDPSKSFKLPPAFDFEFDSDKLPLNTLRDLIFKEVECFSSLSGDGYHGVDAGTPTYLVEEKCNSKSEESPYSAGENDNRIRTGNDPYLSNSSVSSISSCSEEDVEESLRISSDEEKEEIQNRMNMASKICDPLDVTKDFEKVQIYKSSNPEVPESCKYEEHTKLPSSMSDILNNYHSQSDKKSSRELSDEEEERKSDEEAEEQLPRGWEKRTHKKTGRTYYINHVTKKTTWKLPTVPVSNSQNQVKHTNNRVATLPAGWQRRTDSTTGRMYYIHLATQKRYASLPSAISSKIISSSNKQQRDQPERKKSTVPYSPQFSQMSWQKKKV